MREALTAAWTNVAAFVPKFIGFLAILIIGYFVAKAIAKIVDRILERLGFDRAVERGGVKRALSRSPYDASGLLSQLVFYVVMLFVLQLAFGIWGPNAISDLIAGVISYLPRVFAAILIVVVGAAIAAAAREIVVASLGGLSYGNALGALAGGAILTITAFAALSQLRIAPAIVNGLFYALLAIVVGSTVIALGVGGIPIARRYLERMADRTEDEAPHMREEIQGAETRIQARAEERREQMAPSQAGSTHTDVPADDGGRRQRSTERA